MSMFDIAALLLLLSALFGWLNHQLLRLPHSIGLLVLRLASSLLLILAQLIFPQVRLFDQVGEALRQIDFTQVVINGMLAFLLFAGALNVNIDAYGRERCPCSTSRLWGQSFRPPRSDC